MRNVCYLSFIHRFGECPKQGDKIKPHGNMKTIILIMPALIGISVSGLTERQASIDPRQKALAVADAYKQVRAKGDVVSGSSIEEMAKELGYDLTAQEAKFLYVHNPGSPINRFLAFCPDGTGEQPNQ